VQTPAIPSALYPGSFDPVHLGHVAVIRKASLLFDRIVVAVMGNPEKPSGLFSVGERVQLLEVAVEPLANVCCVSQHGLAVEAARLTTSDVIIRTGHKDSADEWAMLAMNHLMTGIDTCFVPPDPLFAHLSASAIRSLVAEGQVAATRALVPDTVFEALTRRADAVTT
jgi:pantetheine-phosphate adenylyltransferase